MKKALLIFTIVGVAIIGLAALWRAPEGTPTVEAIRKEYIQDLERFGNRLEQFKLSLEDPEDGLDTWQLKFRNMRTAFKDMEFLLAKLSEKPVRMFLNGPPLPVLIEKVAEVDVMQARGMQIIEEHLYAEDASRQREELLRLANQMLIDYKDIKKIQTILPFTDRQVLEALRAGVFRVMSLGLTGFDTPGSGESIRESGVSLEGMHETVKLYFPYLKENDKALADSIDANFAGAIQFIHANNNFDAFDRLNFIRNYLEPLYAQLLRLHLALGVETVYHTTNMAQPIEYESPHMFSAETFNDHYYAGIGARKESQEVIALGQLLFFDPILSANNERACASCHRPELAFTDGVAKSVAMNFSGDVGRNAPTVINSAIADRYFYDLRSDRLENQAEHVIFNPKEFNTKYADIIEKLNTSSEYKALFKEAFGREPFIQGITRALAAYVRNLKSFDSPVDRYLRGEDVSLKPEVQEGFNLFMGKAVCGTCHFAPTYTGLVPPYFVENESEVIGVPADPKAEPLEIDPDFGRYDNGRPEDHARHFKYSFKTTTVRNAALTAPYMHNGAYKTLEEVVDFYNKGGGGGMGIDLPDQTLPFDHLDLTAKEQKAIVSFMEALTDTSGLTTKPARLPAIDGRPEWNDRTIGRNLLISSHEPDYLYCLGMECNLPSCPGMYTRAYLQVDC
jgi:cytochrome c peroxidase